jgi:hypothetical protein
MVWRARAGRPLQAARLRKLSRAGIAKALIVPRLQVGCAHPRDVFLEKGADHEQPVT